MSRWSSTTNSKRRKTPADTGHAGRISNALTTQFVPCGSPQHGGRVGLIRFGGRVNYAG
jgi:hypothetical protein